MRRRLLAASALALLAGAAALGLSTRQPDAPTPIVDGRLPNSAAVKATLESLGYTPTDGGGENHLITRKLGQWETSYFILLNSDKSILWIKCYLGTIENPTTYDIAHYLKLLDEQGRISPRLFFTTPADNGNVLFWICRGLDNRALTPELINNEIAALEKCMADCVNSWNFTHWTRTTAAPTPTPAPAETP